MAESLRDLLIEELRDAYHAEKQALRAYPQAGKKASSASLKELLKDEVEETHEHINKIEQVFEKLGQRARTKTCEAMKGLIEEMHELFEEDLEAPLLDTAILASLQKIKHYEIASYGTLKAYASAVGEEEAASLLGEILDGEKESDEEMTRLATEELNPAAAGNEEEGEEDEEGEDEEGGEEGEQKQAAKPAPKSRSRKK